MPEPLSDEILETLRHVVDPELGINVVDLGLVYVARLTDGHAHVVMTMTTAACPLGESIVSEASANIRRNVPGITSVSVDLVWDPPWDPSMMSAAARTQLGWK